MFFRQYSGSEGSSLSFYDFCLELKSIVQKIVSHYVEKWDDDDCDDNDDKDDDDKDDDDCDDDDKDDDDCDDPGNEDFCPEGDPLGQEKITGTSGDDALLTPIEGYSGFIVGNDGDDLIEGSGWDDYLMGNEGDDIIIGDCGDDYLLGGGNNDILEGGPGNDRLRGDRGVDTVTGGEGNDVFEFRGSGNTDGEVVTITDYTDGEDSFEFVGVTSGDVSFAQNGDDVEIYISGGLEGLVLNSVALDVEAAASYA